MTNILPCRIKYGLIVFLFLLASAVQAQSPADTLSLKSKKNKALNYKTPVKLQAKGLRLGIDTPPLFQSAFDPDFVGATAHIGLNFNDRYWLSSDIGFEDANRRKNQHPFYSNKTKGSFIRIGIDYNISYWKVPSGAALLLGLHYGRSTFSNHLTNPAKNITWGHIVEEIDSPKVRGSWVEPRFTLQTIVLKRFSMAAMLGLRIRAGMKGYEALPNEIPGFGYLKHRAMLAFGYRVCYELQWGKKAESSSKAPRILVE